MDERREILEKNLMKNSLNVSKIVKEWAEDSKGIELVFIPSGLVKHYTIDEFCDKQKLLVRRAKTNILN